jgi:hypothetical protein
MGATPFDNTALDDSGSRPRFECELPATPRSLVKLRARFGAWLDCNVRDRFVRNDLVLTMSEMANAALPDDASRTPHDEAIHACAWTDRDGIVLEVIDGPSDMIEAGTRSLGEGDGGRGLAVIATLADVLTVDDADGATAIRVRRDWPRGDEEHRFTGE